MSKSYDDPRFGVEQVKSWGNLAALNGTNSGAVNLGIKTCNKAMILNNARVNLLVGGTDAVTKLILNQSLAGTGALTALGTYAFGTQANLTTANWAVSGTFAAGDAIVLTSAAGTSTQARVADVELFVQETFA